MVRVFPKRLVASLFLAALVCTPARAATAYMLNWHNYQPYYKETIAGPFDTLQECDTVKNQQPYQSGGYYACDMMVY